MLCYIILDYIILYYIILYYIMLCYIISCYIIYTHNIYIYMYISISIYIYNIKSIYIYTHTHFIILLDMPQLFQVCRFESNKYKTCLQLWLISSPRRHKFMVFTKQRLQRFSGGLVNGTDFLGQLQITCFDAAPSRAIAFSCLLIK